MLGVGGNYFVFGALRIDLADTFIFKMCLQNKSLLLLPDLFFPQLFIYFILFVWTMLLQLSQFSPLPCPPSSPHTPTVSLLTIVHVRGSLMTFFV